MKIDDNHYVNYTTENVVDKKRRRKSTRTIFTETKGAVTSKRIVKSRESRFTSDIISICFIGSMLLIFGGIFFGGYFETAVNSTRVNSSINNSLNGVDYEYNISYVDYDYIKKIDQLQGFRNVFSLDDFNNEEEQISLLRIPNPVNFMEGGKYSDDRYIINQMLNVDQVCHIQQASFEYDNQNYIYYYLFADVLIMPSQYISTYNNYVNSSNVLSWVDYYKLTLGDSKEWYDDVVYAFKVINAPIIWIRNFIYDLGVLVAFITIW